MTSNLNRRDFLKVMSIGSAGLLVAVYFGGCSPAAGETSVTATSTTPPADPTATPQAPQVEIQPNIYVLLNNHNEVTITAFRTEMGQGIRTAIAMVIADDMDIPWEWVKVILQAPANPAFGDQLTGGSASIQNHYGILRAAGAEMRTLLMQAAAEKWNVKTEDCATEPGYAIHPDGQQKLAYADLVEAASKMKVPERFGAYYKQVTDFHIQGQKIGHFDAAAIVTGKAAFGFDVKLPDMRYAALARPPVFGGRFESYDASQALAIPGVLTVHEIRDSIAVVAENTWTAFRGRDALKIQWQDGKNASLSSESIMESLSARIPKPADAPANTYAVTYDMPYEAHATMEPMNCAAHVHDGLCEVWAPTQDPQNVQRGVSSATGISQKDVTVNVPLCGGGFGRRLQNDYAVEAALVSQAAGVPIQVVWTREDDIKHDYYHAASHHYASAPLDTPRRRNIRSADGGTFIPTGAWRSVGEFSYAFPNESFVDELAFQLQRDPLEFRLEIYTGRGRAVIELAADKAGWGSELPSGWGRGIGYHATFGVTHVAQVAEVEVDEKGNVRVHRIVCTVDCGHVVNPDNVEAQMQGGIVFGLTAALKAQITLQNGQVQQNNFMDYPIIRMSEMPQIEVYILESDAPPTGIGEMGVPPVAPAVANAIFAATGKRIRHIPILPEDLV